MNTKEYLAQYHNIDRRIKDKLNEANRWMDIAYGRSVGSSKEIKHDTIQVSHDSQDKIADAVAKSVDYYNQAIAMSEEMVDKKHRIEVQISAIVDESNYNILHAHYIDGMSLNDIAYTEKFSYKTAKRKYDVAIQDFETRFGKQYL